MVGRWKRTKCQKKTRFWKHTPIKYKNLFYFERNQFWLLMICHMSTFVKFLKRKENNVFSPLYCCIVEWYLHICHHHKWTLTPDNHSWGVLESWSLLGYKHCSLSSKCVFLLAGHQCPSLSGSSQDSVYGSSAMLCWMSFLKLSILLVQHSVLYSLY